MIKPSENYKKSENWHTLNNFYRADEKTVVENLMQQYKQLAACSDNACEKASAVIEQLRNNKLSPLRIESLLQTYRLSTQEGLALMCMAESLLRIPDKTTKSRLIRDKLNLGEWNIAKEANWVENLANFSLAQTSSFLNIGNSNSFLSIIPGLLRRFGEPLIRQIMLKMISVMGTQFVVAEKIEKAVQNKGNKLYSFDMLGESAKTSEDAEKYFNSYLNAINALKEQTADMVERSSVSIKLSALHPRYEVLKRNQAKTDLTDKLLKLCLSAKAAGIMLTVDAEETERLEMSLEIFETVYKNSDLKNWGGLGLAVQAYQKRASTVIDWLIELTQNNKEPIHIRLVKGAYWDSEIKWCQERGLTDYPVFTQKAHTDLSYLVCATKILKASPLVYGQFATHNAYTAIFVKELANSLNVANYELQRLHGMGETLYEQLNLPRVRIYGPVGIYKDLLAYLVRRLLENGANSSFVHQIYDRNFSVQMLTKSTDEHYQQTQGLSHDKIKKPVNIYQGYRRNSIGIDLSSYEIVDDLQNSLKTYQMPKQPDVMSGESLTNSLNYASQAQSSWEKLGTKKRAQIIENLGDLLQQNEKELINILCIESKKTIADAIAEVREAIDFCYYYAKQAVNLFEQPVNLPSPTGEINQLSYHARGIFVCIAPWNFPLAIFLGQVVAALVTGNAVLAKPAHQTPIIGWHAVNLARKAGVPKDVLQFINCKGSDISKYLLSNNLVKGVVFTGSTDTAIKINQTLAARNGAIIPLIAETGGMNAMIVDSSALHEQVVTDVISSAFQSAGQRCSALRILFAQEDIIDELLHMLENAMKELKIGNTTEIDTDVGPVIDSDAKNNLEKHINYLKSLANTKKAQHIYSCPINVEGDFIAPQAWRIDNIDVLKEEVFGPILHVISFKANELEKVFEQVNSVGYGLTMGVHSRLESTIATAERLAKVGNLYINRNMIGAVVGVQPFGGEGLSGTGPKAGGPNYLIRFMGERTVTNNVTACGGNITLLSSI
jgi:RHH-type proline utilization regulon transcriptional repressor/proline dehydrogenase/delta 1-pyrroline-5-carboxylate dehydrogenase